MNRLSTEHSVNGLRAIAVDSSPLTVVVIPELGGKIWQISDSRTGRGLLWHNPRLQPRSVPWAAPFDDLFFGGWDESFPNDISESILGEQYPDHGELWGSPWDWEVLEHDRHQTQIALTLCTPISAVSFTKVIAIRDDWDSVRVSWRIENRLGSDLPYLFKQHIAVPAVPGATIELPANRTILTDYGRPRVPGTATFDWPILVDGAGTSHDMSRMPAADGGVVELQYATGLVDGRCAVRYPDGSGVSLGFDVDVFPACWTFASYGGWRAHEVVVLEPATGFPLSVQAGTVDRTHQVLRSGQVFEAVMTFQAIAGSGGAAPDHVHQPRQHDAVQQGA